MLVFVTDADGHVIEQAQNAYQPAAFRKWLVEQADAYERTHPRTRMPFVRATVTVSGEGDARTASCGEIDAAREEERPVLVFVGRSERPDGCSQVAIDVDPQRLERRDVEDADFGPLLLVVQAIYFR